MMLSILRKNFGTAFSSSSYRFFGMYFPNITCSKHNLLIHIGLMNKASVSSLLKNLLDIQTAHWFLDSFYISSLIMLTKLLHFVRLENEEESHMNLIYEARLWIKLLRQKAEDFKKLKARKFLLNKVIEVKKHNGFRQEEIHFLCFSNVKKN